MSSDNRTDALVGLRAQPPGETPPSSVEEAPPEAGTESRERGSLAEPDVHSLITRDYFGLRLLITRRTGDPEVAADLLNEAICTTWEKWRAGQILRPEQIAGYVFQVALNLLRNRRRAVAERSDRRVSLDTLHEAQTPASIPDDTLEEWIAAKVKTLIQSLSSSRDRMVLVRFYLQEEDKESICREMKLTALQFDKVLHRARRRLRDLLESHGIKGSDVLCLLAIV